MSYASTANRPDPRAALGAIGIPAGFGVLLITGLAVTGGPIAIDPPLVAEEYPVEVPVEVDLDPVVVEESMTTEQTPTQSEPVQPSAPAPRPETDFTFNNSVSGPITDLPGFDGGLGTAVPPVDFGPPPPAPTPAFDPISAAPRGNPGNWIRNSDYRSSWINRGFEGVAGFTLDIDTNGRVSNCTITRSTGHSQLDDATCRLLRGRARFTAAKDASGNTVAGTFSSSVKWDIPE